jgi:uncharacterized protein (TIGR00369 family)
MSDCANDEPFLSVVKEIFNERIPFHRVLGLTVESISREGVRVSFRMRDELMGHYQRRMVHGGVLSSVIDVTGGLSAFMGIQEKMPNETLEARLERFGRVSTIDLRVDFLRPGIGAWFVATAHTLRTGNKVAVVRTEVKSDQGDLIAVGTGSYVVA